MQWVRPVPPVPRPPDNSSVGCADGGSVTGALELPPLCLRTPNCQASGRQPFAANPEARLKSGEPLAMAYNTAAPMIAPTTCATTYGRTRPGGNRPPHVNCAVLAHTRGEARLRDLIKLVEVVSTTSGKRAGSLLHAPMPRPSHRRKNQRTPLYIQARERDGWFDRTRA
jgi:hypothetical protein